jgi:hypothetical protein
MTGEFRGFCGFCGGEHLRHHQLAGATGLYGLGKLHKRLESCSRPRPTAPRACTPAADACRQERALHIHRERKGHRRDTK